MRILLSLVFPLIAMSGLSACIFPIPHGYSGTGLNPTEVWPGYTTRSQLKYKGAPSAQTPDDRFFLYSHSGKQSWSIGIIGVGYGDALPLNSSRWQWWILLEFDRKGVVKNKVIRDCQFSCQSPLSALLAILRTEYTEELAIKYLHLLGQPDIFRELITQNDTSTMNWLLAQNDTVSARDKDGQTILHIAVSKSDLDIVKLLLMYGADPNAKDQNGETPLHYAARQSRAVIVDELIEHGADVNLRSSKGMSPLDAARDTRPRSTNIIELLERHSAK